MHCYREEQKQTKEVDLRIFTGVSWLWALGANVQYCGMFLVQFMNITMSERCVLDKTVSE
jgi:hypothetical protein